MNGKKLRDEWQSIASAPDNRPILVIGGTLETDTTAPKAYDTPVKATKRITEGKVWWFVPDTGIGYYDVWVNDPTHWTELPKVYETTPEVTVAVRVDFFRESGKWYDDSILNWPVAENASDGDARGAFKRVLKAHFTDGRVDMFAVVTADNPVGFPLLLLPGER